MAYEKTNWVNGETPISAENLNKMEEGIEEAGKTGGILEGTIVAYDGDTIPDGYEEVPNPNNYSTEEKFTGKYSDDGKKVYEKTYIANIAEKNATLFIDLGFTIDTLWDIKGSITYVYNTTILKLPLNIVTADGKAYAFVYNGNQIAMSSTWVGTARVNIEYTKTTD